MKVDKELLVHVADVARLELTDDEISEFLPQLKEILNAFSEISSVDTKGIRPSYHAVEIKNALRKDVPKKPLSNSDALKNSHDNKDGYFIGPRVV